MSTERAKHSLKLLSFVALLSLLTVSLDSDTNSIYSAVSQAVPDTISLAPGWNLISFSVQPADKSVEAVLNSITGNYDYVKGIDNGAEVLYDAASPGASTLQMLDPLHGYYVHMLAADELIVDGSVLAKTTPMTLNTGINLVSYLPDNDQSVEDALGSIVGEVVFVKAIDHAGIAHGQGANGGLSYDPTIPERSTLKKFQKGFGYWIKVNQPAQLVYASDPDQARELVAQGQQALEDGDIASARSLFEQALAANPFDPEANTGAALVTLVEQVESTQGAIADVKTIRENINFPLSEEARSDVLTLISQSPFLPYIELSSSDGGQVPPDVGATVSQSVYETYVNIMGQSETVFNSSSVTALNETATYADDIVPTIDTALEFIRKAEKNPNTAFRISANGFNGLIDNDLDGDGVSDVNSGSGEDFYMVDQADLLILNGQLNSTKAHLRIATAYNLDVPPDFQPSPNADSIFTPDEYFPPPPLYTINDGRREDLMNAGNEIVEARMKTIMGINMTLAETEDDHEFYPVNGDPELKEMLGRRISDPDAIDLTELQAVISGGSSSDAIAKPAKANHGAVALDLDQAPLNIPRSIRIDLSAFFANPPDDLRDFLSTINLVTNDVTFPDPTLGGIFPDGDIDVLLEYLMGRATLSNSTFNLEELNTSTCDFGDGGGFGTLFSMTFDYSDPNGDVLEGTTARVSGVFSPSGSTFSFVANSPTITGDGFAGDITTGVCLRFASEESVRIDVTINDIGGRTSNPGYVTIPKPEGSNVPRPMVATSRAKAEACSPCEAISGSEN